MELTGQLLDRDALYGLLVKLRDLGLPLLSLHPVMDEQHDESQRSIVEAEDAAE